jgi:hypothetical protein
VITSPVTFCLSSILQEHSRLHPSSTQEHLLQVDKVHRHPDIEFKVLRYDGQQGQAVGWKAGVLKIPLEEMASLATRIGRRVNQPNET